MTTTKDSVVAESLKICFKVARILKKEFPNQVMAIKDDTIIVYSRKSRLIRRSDSRGMSGIYAYFTNYTPHRIVIARSTLLDRKVASTYGHWVFQKIVLYKKEHLIRQEMFLRSLIQKLQQ